MNDGLVHRNELDRRTDSALSPEEHLLVRPGDIAYNTMRMWQGASGLAVEEGMVSPAYVVVAPKAGIDPRFAHHWFKSARMIYLFWAYSHGLTEDRLRLYADDFADVPAVPPPLDVQRRVADLLDAWDRAIEQTERLIAAKKRLKKSVLQQAFRGLPKRPLAEAARIWFSSVDKKVAAGEHSVLLCNYMDVFHNARITGDLPFMRGTASAREIRQNALRRHDVVFTKDSETADEIAETVLVDEDVDGLVCGYHLAIARPIEGQAYGPFLAQAMKHPEIRWQFSRLANGVVRFGLTLKAMEQIDIFLPNLETQKEIGGALYAEDCAIDALARQAGLLRVQKRGLIQTSLRPRMHD